MNSKPREKIVRFVFILLILAGGMFLAFVFTPQYAGYFFIALFTYGTVSFAFHLFGNRKARTPNEVGTAKEQSKNSYKD